VGVSRSRSSQAPDRSPEPEAGSRLKTAGPWAALAVVLALGLAIRVYLAATPGCLSDLQWFYAWADAAHRVDLGEPYRLGGNLVCNYPPGYILVLSQVPWVSELFTGQPFRKPTDRKTGRQDEAVQGLQSLAGRRQLVALQELLANYEDGDSEKYRSVLEARLVRYRLLTPKEFRQMRGEFRGDPAGYREILRRADARIGRLLDTRVPYAPPDRLRRVAVWVKLPALLFDLAGAVLLFAWLRHRLRRSGALIVAGVYLFLPAVIYDSACWGQVDAVHSFLMVLCLLCLVSGASFLTGLVMVVALLTKFQSIMILPIVGAALIRRWHEELTATTNGTGLGKSAGAARVARSIVLVLAGAAVAAAAILIPFAVAGSAGDALGTYAKATEKYHWVSVCAFNPWWFFNAEPDMPRWYYVFTLDDGEPFLGPITPKHVGFAALAAFSLWVMWMVYRRGWAYEPVVAGAAAMAMGFFILPTEIHERYGFPAMILAACLVGAGWRHLPVLLILSAAQFYNLTSVQPMEDPRFAWLMPVANALSGWGRMTYLLVLIHVGCLVYFLAVLYRMPVLPVGSRATSRSPGKGGRPSPRGRRHRPKHA